MAYTGTEDRTQFWKKAIEEQRASGLSIAEYCEVAGTTIDRFYYWKRKIKHTENSCIEGESDTRFMELTVSPNATEKTDSIVIEIGSFRLLYSSRTNQNLFHQAASILQAVCASRDS